LSCAVTDRLARLRMCARTMPPAKLQAARCKLGNCRNQLANNAEHAPTAHAPGCSTCGRNRQLKLTARTRRCCQHTDHATQGLRSQGLRLSATFTITALQQPSWPSRFLWLSPQLQACRRWVRVQAVYLHSALQAMGRLVLWCGDQPTFSLTGCLAVAICPLTWAQISHNRRGDQSVTELHRVSHTASDKQPPISHPPPMYIYRRPPQAQHQANSFLSYPSSNLPATTVLNTRPTQAHSPPAKVSPPTVVFDYTYTTGEQQAQHPVTQAVVCRTPGLTKSGVSCQMVVAVFSCHSMFVLAMVMFDCLADCLFLQLWLPPFVLCPPHSSSARSATTTPSEPAWQGQR
jgi:hypothetical protein